MLAYYNADVKSFLMQAPELFLYNSLGQTVVAQLVGSSTTDHKVKGSNPANLLSVPREWQNFFLANRVRCNDSVTHLQRLDKVFV